MSKYFYHFYAVKIQKASGAGGWLVYRADESLVGYAEMKTKYDSDHNRLKQVVRALWELDEVHATAIAPSAEMVSSGYECQAGDTRVRLGVLCNLEVPPKEIAAAKQHPVLL